MKELGIQLVFAKMTILKALLITTKTITKGEKAPKPSSEKCYHSQLANISQPQFQLKNFFCVFHIVHAYS